MAHPAYAELHCHSHFSFLDGASAPDDLVARAVELGLAGLAVTDHQGLYGAVRFSTAAEAAGLHPVIGVEIELVDAAVPDPGGIVVPARRPWRPGRRPPVVVEPPVVAEGRPARPRPSRARLPGHRAVRKEDHRGIGEGQRGPHLVLLARDATGWRSLCRMVSRANLAGTKAVPQFTQALLAEHAEGLIALSGCREGELARRLRAGDREGARAVAERYAGLFGRGDSAAASGFVLELTHHLLPDDDWLVSETARLAEELGLPVVVTNDVHYDRPEGRELQDVLTAIRHGRSLPELLDLRRPDGESYLKGAAALLALPPGEPSTADADPVLARAWRAGIAASAEIAAGCQVDLVFERYRFPGFDVPKGETPFSHLSSLCWEGAKRRYHPMTPGVVRQLAHELDVIEKTGLAEFFLICWDLMRFAKSRHIPAQGRGSAADSIVAYVLGITRVDPIRHELLFERFINEGRTAYPDVDIDFSSERREEVIQYVYERYGTEHTGMVCNLVTYRARSAVREVGYALGFPRPLVDRVAKALETYDSVMVRRDLEAEGGFAQFFARPGEESQLETPAIARVPGRRPRPDRRDGPAEPPARRPVRGGGARRRPPCPPTPRVRRRAGNGGSGATRRTAGSGTRSGRSRRAPPGRPRRRRGRPRRLPGERALDPRGGAEPRAGALAGPATRASRTGHPGGSGVGHAGPGAAPVRPAPWTSRSAARARSTGPSTARAASSSTTAAARATRARPPGAGRGNRSRCGRTAATRSCACHRRPSSDRRTSTRTAARWRSLSDWERWLELCARIDGFPRHLSIHSGGMLVTAAPLIDIAPIERATMENRVVVQFDKRDVETMKLIKLDLLGLGMLAAIDECVQLIEHDCAVCLDLDHIPEEIPEVFEMLQAADTVGVFQVESRAQMQTLPKSRPQSLDDLVVEVAIIRPGPIQGNAVHPYLRRKQGIEPVAYLHPSLAPILHDTLGVILYQEQVMKIAIDVAGFTPAGSDGFRRAMGTWRSTREMEKLHEQFVEGCISVQGMPRDDAEELFRQCAAFASFGFAKSHAAAFARTAYESSFLKLFYPAQFVVGLVNAQPMGFYPVEVLVNDAKRHGVAVLPVDVNRSAWRTTTEWVGRPGWAMAGPDGDDGSHDGDDGEPMPEGCGIDGRPAPVRSPACVIPGAAARDRWAAESMTGWGVRLGLHLVKGIGEEQEARLDAELARGPVHVAGGRGRADRSRRGGRGAADPRRRRWTRWAGRDGSCCGSCARWRGRRRVAWTAGRCGAPARAGPPGGRWTCGCRRPRPRRSRRSRSRSGWATPTGWSGLDARRQAVSLFREALDRLGAVTNADLAEHRPGPVRIGGLVVTRQHPMTARGTVFLALEDETGMVNVTLWPDTWQRLRSVVRRHALLLVDGDLQREANVVNVIARSVTPLVEAAGPVGGPSSPAGVRQIGMAGMRRMG